VGRIYDRDIGPAIGSVKARAVTESHIDDMLDDIMERGAKVLANRAHAYLKAAFNFGIKWDRKNSKRKKVSFGIASNPVEHIEKPYAGEKPRNRWLTADEIYECWGEWQDPEMIALPIGIALRLLLATAGQRVEEVLEASWEEFHLTEEEPFWLIPPERAKNGNEHYVPLTQLALDLLAEAREHCGDSLYLFPMTKDTKRPMDSNYLGGHLREYCKRSDVQKFTARDMRRTAKTHMAQLQPVKLAQSDDQPDSWLPVTLEMRNRIQNHAFSDIGSQVYDCWTYIPEKRAVLLALEQRLRNIISESPESKVVPIEKAKEKRWQA
jgi:integrase